MPDLNVRFLKGTQSSLNTLLSGSGSRFTAGAFYLTEDTDRLYFAQSATELVPLNQFIRSVTSSQFNALTSADVAVGDYYYIAENNILAVCKTINGGTGSKPTWTQLNPDTNTTYDFNFADGQLILKGNDSSTDTFHYKAVSAGTGYGEGVVVETTTTTVANDTLQIGHKAYAAVDSAATGMAAAQQPTAGGTFNVITGLTVANGHVTGYNTGTVKIPEAVDPYTFTIGNETSGSSSTPSTNISLTGSNGYFGQVLLEADGKNISVAANGAGKIKYTHIGPDTTTSAAAGTSAETAATLAHGGSFTVLTGATIDGTGHIINVKTKQFTLPSDIKLSTLAVDTTDKGKLVATLSDGSKVETAAETFYHNITVDGTTNKVINQGSLGTFYSATEVDRRISSAVAALDAVVYKGTVGTGGTVTSLPTTGVKNGDMYMVKTAGTYGGHSCDVGDLLIAQGTEGDDGIISGTITWTYVPSGNDLDTRYSLTRTGNKIELIASTDATGSNSGEFTITADNKWIEITNLGISHIGPDTASSAAVATSAETATSLTDGGTFTVLTGATADGKGHIINVKTKEFTLPQESKYALSSSANSTSITLTGSGAAASQVDTVTFVQGNDIVITGATAGQINIAHETFTTSASTTTSTTIGTTRKFTALTAITTDNGHVTAYQPTEFTLPAESDSTYALSGSTTASASFGTALTMSSAASAVTISQTLTGGGDAAGSITSASVTFKSQTISLANSGSEVELELIWGTF